MIFEEKVKTNRTAFIHKVQVIAAKLNIEPDWLMGVMNFESAGTFSPTITNPYSNAVGLIQFMPSTAKSMNTTTYPFGVEHIAEII